MSTQSNGIDLKTDSNQCQSLIGAPGARKVLKPIHVLANLVVCLAIQPGQHERIWKKLAQSCVGKHPNERPWNSFLFELAVLVCEIMAQGNEVVRRR